jgi:hypothetical protein
VQPISIDVDFLRRSAGRKFYKPIAKADDGCTRILPDPYCYPGTDILINRAELRDHATLQAFEVEMVTQRLQEPLPDGRFGVRHDCAFIATCSKTSTYGPESFEPFGSRNKAVRSATPSTSTGRCGGYFLNWRDRGICTDWPRPHSPREQLISLRSSMPSIRFAKETAERKCHFWSHWRAARAIRSMKGGLSRPKCFA